MPSADELSKHHLAGLRSAGPHRLEFHHASISQGFVSSWIMAKAWLKGRIQAFSDQESQSDPKATLNSALATKIQRDREVEHGSQLLKSEWPLLWADVDRLIET